ncbi:SirB2 family protein [Teredinibacter haidensis]|uniref:SirB2 family protein n=1 Tax=Teredinibacter haidensis TaxID=2731755 RepID=UPI000948B9CB
MLLYLKYFHIAFAVTSIFGFITRVLWLTYKPEFLQNRAVKLMPHLNDTALFITGITMATAIGYPLNAFYWFTVKLTLLLTYICLGFLTLKTTKANLDRFALLSVSIITYASIAILAAYKPNFS